MNKANQINSGILLARTLSVVLIAANTLFAWQKSQSIYDALYFMLFMSSFWYLGFISREVK